MEIQWTDADPSTEARRYVCAEKFARAWRFKIRFKRRTEWQRIENGTREMWETLLDALERRYRRREGVSDEDLATVREVIARLPDEITPEDVLTQRRKDHTKNQKEGE